MSRWDSSVHAKRSSIRDGAWEDRTGSITELVSGPTQSNDEHGAFLLRTHAGTFQRGAAQQVQSQDKWRKELARRHVDVTSTMVTTPTVESPRSLGTAQAGGKASVTLPGVNLPSHRKRTGRQQKKLARVKSPTPVPYFQSSACSSFLQRSIFRSAHDERQASVATSVLGDGPSMYESEGIAGENPEDSALESETRTSATLAHEAASVGDPRLDNVYFGPRARSNFFDTLRSIDKSKWLTQNVVDFQLDTSMLDPLKHALSQDDCRADDAARVGLMADSYSPRGEFLRRVIHDRRDRGSVLPEPLVVRRRWADKLDLANRSLGDPVVAILAEVLDTMPGLRALNLQNNRLTDASLKRIIEAVCEKAGLATLTDLNLSQNDLDERAVRQLAGFLERPRCGLQHLALGKADIDDAEAIVLMRSVEQNRSLKTLDLHSNPIGGPQERMMRQTLDASQLQSELAYADPPTGGQAIARMLSVNQTLELLDLQWNTLGRHSGIAIGVALKQNCALTHLNISHNAIGTESAMQIGDSLASNVHLSFLDLSFNDIKNRGAMVIAEALHTNSYLKHVKLDGNPLGPLGARAVLRSLNFAGCRRIVTMSKCSFDIQDQGPLSFDLQNPAGNYILKLTDPYHRCIANELLRLATLRNGCSFRKLVHHEHTVDGFSTDGHARVPRDSKGRAVRLVRAPQTLSYFGELVATQRARNRNSKWRFARLKFIKNSLVAAMKASDVRLEVAQYRLIDAESTGSGHAQPWKLPDVGTLEVEFQYMPRPPTELALANRTGVEGLVFTLLETPVESRLEIMELACRDSFFLTHQCQSLCGTVKEVFDKRGMVQVMATLLPRILDRESILHFVHANLDTNQIMSLQSRMGAFFSVLMGSTSGRYVLDLKRSSDRDCALRIAEIDAMEQSWLQRELYSVLQAVGGCKDPKQWAGWTSTASAPSRAELESYMAVLERYSAGGVAQNGNWTGFRNTKFRGQDVSGDSFPQRFFAQALTDKQNGMLEFDFVSCSRAPVHATPVSSVHLQSILAKCGCKPLNRSATDDNQGNGQTDPVPLSSPSPDQPRKAAVPYHKTISPTLAKFKAAASHTMMALRVVAHGQDRISQLYDSTVEVLSHKLCGGMEDFERWAASRTDFDRTTEGARALCHMVASRCCELLYDKVNRRVVRVMHVLRVRINHATRPIVLTRTQGTDASSEAEASVGSPCASDHPDTHSTTWFTKAIQHQAGQPLWSLDICAKRFIAEEVLAHLSLSFHDVRVSERCRDVEHDESPWSPRTMDGVSTVCFNHYCDVYVRRLPLAMASTIGADGIVSDWAFIPIDEAEGEPTIPLGLHRRLQSLRMLTGTVFLSTAQVIEIADAFSRNEPSPTARLKAATEVIVATHCRLLDLEDFVRVINWLRGVAADGVPRRRNAATKIEAERRAIAVVAERLGYLAIMSPHEPNWSFSFRLVLHDHWKVVNILTRLAVEEDGDNWIKPIFRRTENHMGTGVPSEIVPGWELPKPWDEIGCDEDRRGVPHDGILHIDGYSSPQPKQWVRDLLFKTMCLAGFSRPWKGIMELENDSHLSLHAL